MQTAAFRIVLACLGLVASAGVHAGNEDIAAAARGQVGVTLHYDPAYRKLAYPQGDVPADRGVCTDVIVRALRTTRAMDLQYAAGDYLPGDIVAWDLGRGILHIGIVSDRASVDGTPFVVHNIGAGTREEDILFRYTVIGHYRLPPASAGAAQVAPMATH